MSAKVRHPGRNFIKLNLRAEDRPGNRDSMLKFKKTDEGFVLVQKVTKVGRAEAGVCWVTPVACL
jgi:hypothetical protein